MRYNISLHSFIQFDFKCEYCGWVSYVGSIYDMTILAKLLYSEV
jgi:hypothetical protein